MPLLERSPPRDVATYPVLFGILSCATLFPTTFEKPEWGACGAGTWAAVAYAGSSHGLRVRGLARGISRSGERVLVYKYLIP